MAIAKLGGQANARPSVIGGRADDAGPAADASSGGSMGTERLPMRKTREILRLKELKRSHREIRRPPRGRRHGERGRGSREGRAA